MAMFFDRRVLNSVLAAATNVRKAAELRAQDREAVVYVLKIGGKASPLAMQAMRTIHETAVREFGGQVFGDGPAVFDRAADAIRAALHALQAADIGGEMMGLPDCRIALVQGPVTTASDGRVSGKAVARAGKLLSRAAAGEVVLEPGILKTPLTGFHDIMAAEARKGKIPGIGPVTTITVKPLGLKRALDDELEEVDAELRARPSR